MELIRYEDRIIGGTMDNLVAVCTMNRGVMIQFSLALPIPGSIGT